MKKGQAAMEFLMTYGWAILVVLAAIGALAYFGVLSPGKLLPERTVFKAPVPNVDNAVVELSGGTVSVEIPFRNNKGDSIIIDLTPAITTNGDCTTLNSITGTDKDGNALVDDTTSIANGEIFILTFNCTTSKVEGDKFKADLTFDYTASSTGQSRPHSGSVDAEVLA